MTLHAGGCLCGAIRYEVTWAPGDVADYCHCRECRKASGAPAIAWVQVAPERFRVTVGAPRAYASSADATRWFCRDCGSQISMSDISDTSIGVTVATLDEPGAITPTTHGWTCERIAWFDVKDDLPRHAQSPIYDL